MLQISGDASNSNPVILPEGGGNNNSALIEIWTNITTKPDHDQ
jgi:hypothetical protein